MEEKKEDALKITLLGSNSGRNAGDAAILASILKSLTEALDSNVSFEVPTTHPQFVEENYSSAFAVRALSVMPWTGSIRLLGIPTLRSIKRTDLTLITDGIIFDVKLFNPLFNFLITLIFLVPWARFWGKKVVCYDVGIGPLNNFFGRLFARWVGNGCDLIMVRDEDSKELFRSVGVTKEIHITADAAFTNWGASEERTDALLAEVGLQEDARKNSLLGINVTTYVDRWLQANEKVAEKKEFLPTLAEVLLRLKMEHGITPLIFTTQVMDAAYGRELQQMLGTAFLQKQNQTWKPGLFTNEVLSNHEILSLSSKCRLYVGMRLHSLIIASRSGAPVVGLVYAPKVRSILKQLKSSQWAFELANLDADGLYRSLLSAWEVSATIQEEQQEVVAGLTARAEGAAMMIRERYGRTAEEQSGAQLARKAINE